MLFALGAQQDSIRSFLKTVDITTGQIKTVYTASQHFEAPNWSRDGKFFLINKGGRLYRLDVGAAQPQQIPTGTATRVNNDHGMSPDGKWLVISSEPTEDWLTSTVYLLPIAGGTPQQLTTKSPSFWHGWSPDGKTLAFVGRRNDEFDIYTIPATGGDERRITTCKGLDDGPDYSPDGAFIYYNSFCSGRMQIWRMRPDGSQPEQLTNDQYANWFPHPSPDGRWIVFLSFIEDQGQNHPFGKQVKLRLMDLRDRSVRDLTSEFFGGQGTINVPSWSPDSRHVAFVSYEQHVKAPSSKPELLIRIDDIGMNHSVNLALAQLAETKLPLSASVMFACPWYQEAVAILKQNPQIAVGVHLVLNSEWKYYRWGPVLGKAAVPSLVDSVGYFLPSTDAFLASHYDLTEVERELTAQVERAERSGLKIAYVDYHMGTAVSTPQLRAIVERIAAKFGVGISRYFGESSYTTFAAPVARKEIVFHAHLDSLAPNRVNLVVVHVAQATPEIRVLVDMNDPEQNSASGEPLMALHRQAELDMLLNFARGADAGRVTLINYAGVISRMGLSSMKAPSPEPQ